MIARAALRSGCLLLAFLLAVACDNRQAFHRPDPTLARMLEQRRTDPYEASEAFADGKTMREPPAGAIAQDVEDPSPPPITRALLVTGRTRFDVTCAICHGITGDGVSAVATAMRSRPPPSLHEPRFRALTRERLFTIVTEGYGLMPSYAGMLTPDERWAVISYLQALQLSQDAPIATLPLSVREELARVLP
jgi:mono/diheme cytochrome c family protein